VTTGRSIPDRAPGNLLLPTEPPRAFAVFASRRPPTNSPEVVSAIPSALAALGIGVLVLDLEYPHRTPDTADLSDTGDEAAVTALRRAADSLAAAHRAPSLLIGHSAAGPVVLAAAASLPAVRAVVTIGSPAPRVRRLPSVPLLVMHAPADRIVPVQEAGRVFAAARHPKSFIALDGVDHAVSEPHRARQVAGLIAAWVEPYLPPRAPAPPPGPTGYVVVRVREEII